jgi:uncharacterized membrane protein YphA (DoxX/SURF4 family)
MKISSRINFPKFFMTALRMAIGWHFLYEGISKLLISNWGSYSYLANSTGPLSGFYHWLASSGSFLNVIDFLNVYGLILIGLGLFVGLFTKMAAGSGVVLLLLYYFAYPPFGNTLFSSGEGHLFIVDKLFIECSALLFILFFREKGFCIDAVIRSRRRDKAIRKATADEVINVSSSRRDLIKNLASLPLLGIMGWLTARHNRENMVDVISGATIQLNQTAIGELKGVLPKGRIGGHEISRLVLGGNLIGGWAHSRDLIYVPSLFKAYNTEKKIYETIILAEKAGINTINIGFATNELIARYRKMTGSRIKVISQVAPNMDKGDYYEQINRAVDFGADILQVQGNWCDWLVRDQKTEVIAAMLEKIKSHGLIAGLGAHTIDSLIACVEKGIIPDYYMKTMHHDHYWSAHPRENRVPFEVDGKKSDDHNKFHDNLFCLFPERTAEFVNHSKIPVIGFKVLAAGAIEPEDGFKWAFENGADFICVGMFDFQVVKDVNICIDILAKLTNRKRELYG